MRAGGRAASGKVSRPSGTMPKEIGCVSGQGWWRRRVGGNSWSMCPLEENMRSSAILVNDTRLAAF